MVDDNPLNLELVTDILEAATLEVITFATAEAGIEAAFAEKPDVILMDVGLPGMDGYEAVRILRDDARTAALPIVALTAHAMVNDEARALAAGFTAHIAKPIDTRSLPATVIRLMLPVQRQP